MWRLRKNKMKKLTLKKGKGLLFFVFFLSLLIFSCESKDPKKIVLGTWLGDKNCLNPNGDCFKVTIEKIEGEMFKVTSFWQASNGPIATRVEDYNLMNTMGRIYLQDTHGGTIEIFPEAKKIMFRSCYYLKQ
jgi:major membrane immunogen (membrane-anchored lipoprotein)